jgi:hypothetical protein
MPKPRKSRAKPKDQLLKRGRKREWNADTEKLLLTTLTSGCSLRDACSYAGIKWDTMQAQRTRDPAFAVRLEKARTDVKVGCLLRIMTAAQTQWQANAWWLERVFPEEFGRRKVELTGENGGPVSVNLSIDVDAVAAARLRSTPEGRELLRRERYIAAGKPIPVGRSSLGSVAADGAGEPSGVQLRDEPGSVAAGAALRPARRQASGDRGGSTS